MIRPAKTSFWLLAAVVFATAAPLRAAAEPRTIDERVTRLEQRVGRADALVSVSVVAAVLCAWWAQDTGRNPWLWFFAGLVFSVISLLVLLYKNAAEVRARRAPDRTSPRT